MPDNQNNTETIPKLLNIPLKDWAIIIGIIGAVFTYYVNTAGDSAKRAAQMETILTKLAETQSLLKEIQADHKANYKELEKRTTENSVNIKVLEQRLNEYDKRR
jgi:uncharacterized protein YdbL (DUF1318 family)